MESMIPSVGDLRKTAEFDYAFADLCEQQAAAADERGDRRYARELRARAQAAQRRGDATLTDADWLERAERAVPRPRR